MITLQGKRNSAIVFAEKIDKETKKRISELLGKETIDTNTFGKSTGRSGNYSTNYQISGRELLTPDEVRMLDNQYALLFIRGERPVKDFKFDILKHPNVKLSKDGGAPAYKHGLDKYSFASVKLNEIDFDKADLKTNELDYVILTDDEIEEIMIKIGGNQNE